MRGAAALHLAGVFLKMFMRDRQALFFSLFFPLIFLTVFGYLNNGSPDAVDISIANHADSAEADALIESLSSNPLFNVTTGDEAALKERLMNGEETLVLVIPETFTDATDQTELVMFVDAAQVRLLAFIVPAVEKALVTVERTLREADPMFSLRIEDVKARSQRYIDFLLPGILGFTLMQISIAGSGYNIVEYRRKGILKRLFVTPIRPRDFIGAICLARLAWCLLQVTILLVIAILALDAGIVGSYVSLYFIIVLGTVIFLCIGFCIGSLAKTQQAVGAIGNIVIFPQVFLSGVFFPIGAMPEAIQPLAHALPLSFVVDCLRGIANDGATLASLWAELAGVAIWIALSFALATRLFVWKEVVR